MTMRQYMLMARRAGYGETITVPQAEVFGIPTNFEPSSRSLPFGAQAVYREDRDRDSLQLREYDDHYTLQLDRYNPEYRLVAHAIADVPEYTIGAAVLGAALLGAGSS